MTVRVVLFAAAVLAAASAGCKPKDKGAHLSGNVTFKNQPVPAGWISFTPDVAAGGSGPVKVYQIKDGAYDSKLGDQPPLLPGAYEVRIAGFDGKKIPFYGQGKQIFNPIQDRFTVAEGAATKDWVVPEAAGRNVQFNKTADE